MVACFTISEVIGLQIKVLWGLVLDKSVLRENVEETELTSKGRGLFVLIQNHF